MSTDLRDRIEVGAEVESEVAAIKAEPLFQALVWWDSFGRYACPIHSDPELWAAYNGGKEPEWVVKAREIYGF